MNLGRDDKRLSLTSHNQSSNAAWLTPGRFGLILAICIFAAYPEVVLGLQTFYYRDFGFFGYPLAHYHRDSFWQGEIPLWNPLSNCGLPFLAQWNTLVLYPGSLFYLLFPLSWSLAVFCLLHQFLAGMGMFCLASRWTGNRLAASVAGVAYAFNGLTLNCLMWPNNIAALGWMPWVILLGQRASAGGARNIAAAVAVAGMQMLSGAPEVILLTWITLAALAAGQSFEGLRSAGKVLWRLAAVASLVAALSAAQLFPFLDLLSHAHRDADYGDSAWAMPIWGWANLLVPMFHCIHGFHDVYWQREQYWTSSYYPGAAILALALLAAVLVRKRTICVLALMAVLAVTLALGDAGILYGWLRHSIPQFGFMRYPVKFLVLLTFALPLLAAYAVSHFQNAPRAVRRRPWAIAAIIWILMLGIMFAVVWYAHLHPARDENWTLTWKNGLSRALFLTLTLGGFYLYNRVSSNPPLAPPMREASGSQTSSPPSEGLAVHSDPQGSSTIYPSHRTSIAVGLALIALLASDLLSHMPRQNPVVSRMVFEPGLVRLSPQPRHGDGRAMISPANNLKLYRFATTNAFNDYINNRRLLFANCNLLDAIPKINGFYSLYIRAGDAVRAFLYDSTNTPPAPLCDFLGVAHITDPENFLEWKYRPGYLPLASAGQKPVFADEKVTFEAITSANFNPRQTVFLPPEARTIASGVASRERTPDPSLAATVTSESARGLHSSGGTGGGLLARAEGQPEDTLPSRPTPSAQSHPEAKITAAFTAHQGEIMIDSEQQSCLVIAQNNYHCWQAYSDGAPLQLWQANYAFQAAVVPEGKHHVQLVYRDWGFVAGAVLSLLSLTGCIAAARRRV
jgi:hypothetical protein